MANFKTHINTAIIGSGLASAALLSTNHIGFNHAIWLWFLGTIGGLLPDIDSDNSTSLDTIFGILTLSTVLISVRFISHAIFQEPRFIELIATAITVYGMMRLIVRPLFEHITVHRGSCHSILFLVLSGLITTQLTLRLSGTDTQQVHFIAWLSGGFIFMGGMIHLLLDEICSVDLQNVTIKRSFGTAIKLADFSNKGITLLMIIAVSVLIYISPATEYTIKTLSNWTAFTL